MPYRPGDVDGPLRFRYPNAMASVIEPYVKTRRLRRVEYDRLVDHGMFVGERLELLDGLLVVREPQGSPHAAIVAHIGQTLATAFGPGWHPRLHSPLALDSESEPEPDLAVVAGGPRDYVSAHPLAAALVIEVADSSLRLDRLLKGGLYARAGLEDYWIVNLAEGVLEVHREPQPEADAPYGWVYRSVEILRPPAMVAPLAAPGTRIPVADLLP
jgi:Uma2 family endonuclease